MVRKTLTALAGTTALLIAGSALAAPGHGGGMGGAGGPAGNAGSTASMHSQGPMNASPTGIAHASPNSVLSSGSTTTTTTGSSQATTNSQGLTHASPNGIAHASSNSVLARGAVATTSLTGLSTGETVSNANGTLGTVTRIIYGPGNTTIRAVVVTSASGQTTTLPANSLSISGGVVTTTYGD